MVGDEQTATPDLETYGYADPYDYPELPLPLRLIAVATDGSVEDLRGVGEGDGAYDQVTGILADHGWRAHIAIANTMGLTGNWGVDDVVDAVTEALHEYQELRAELARVRPVVDAARAWKAKRDSLDYPRPSRSPGNGNTSIPEAADLYATVAGLGVDAAATPPPAAAPEATPPIEDDPMLSGWDLVRHRATEALERGRQEFERSERAASASDFQVEELLNAGLLRAAAPDVEAMEETIEILGDPDTMDAIREGQMTDAGPGIDLSALVPAAPVVGDPVAARAGAFTEWGAKWSDGGYCPSTPPRSEDFARQHAHQFGTRPIRRGVGPWVYADTGEPAFDEPAAPTTDTSTPSPEG